MRFLTKKKFIVSAVLLGGAFFAFCWGRFIEPNLLTVTQIEVPLAKWTGTENRMRAVALADLHLASDESESERLARIVKKVLSLNPDVVFLLGDYVEGTQREEMMSAEKIAAGLRPLTERVPVLACLGNHDAFYGNGALIRAFREAGIMIDRKGVYPVVCGDSELNVAISLDADSFGAVPEALPDLQEDSDLPTVLLSHSPDIFSVLVEKSGFDFTLCGHTHGGQICLPGGFPIVSSTREVGTEFAYGLKEIPGNGTMFVSRGLGTSILPLRFWCPPEILVVDFVPAESAD